ncbi:MAG: DNA-directed RNA polymerase subunit omega [Methanoregulaceae archaeon]|nr:DNA-directed RNA polymerase subunit omega [Methanoregulaceae archaeon]
MFPSPDILNEYEHGKFVLSNLAAKRAKQLKEGAMPLVQVDSHHPLTIALAEIAAGKIKAILSEHEDRIELEGAELALITDEPLPAELGMLLPALDETEVALVIGLGEEELIEEAEAEVDTLSLTDLVEVDEEEEVVPAEDDTLSLNDIAAQESADEEEPES